MIVHSYDDAKTNLLKIYSSFQNIVTFDDDVQQIIFTFNQDNPNRLKNGLLEGGIMFLVLSFCFFIAIGGIDLLALLICTFGGAITTLLSFRSGKQHQIIYDFKNQRICSEKRKIQFKNCKKIYVEKVSLNFIPVRYDIMIETPQGSMNLPVLQFPKNEEGERDSENFAQWLITHIQRQVVSS